MTLREYFNALPEIVALIAEHRTAQDFRFKAESEGRYADADAWKVNVEKLQKDYDRAYQAARNGDYRPI